MRKSSLTMMFAVALLGASVAITPAADAACKKCGPKVAACKRNYKTAFNCNALPKTDKKACKLELKTISKANCVAATCKTATTCSPSGAFLD